MLLSIIWLIAGLESNNMTFRPSALLKCLYAAACAALYPHAALAQTPDDRDRDKPLTIVVGLNPPDQRDREARLLAQHIGKHLPGNHKVVVQNMPGAGSVKAANYLAEMAPKDGWTIGMVARGIFTMPLFGNSEARFDPTKFSFIGSRAPETSITLLWHEVPVNTIEEARKREVVLGASGFGTEGGVLPLAYNDALGTKFKVLTGYQGGGEINLAIERREADGRVVSLMTVADWYKAKKIRIILQHAIRKHPDLPDVPLAQDLASNEEGRKLLTFFGVLPGVGYPFFAPPGVAKEKIDILRTAFSATMRDPAYIAEAKTLQSEINPVAGAEIDVLIQELYAAPAPVLERAKKIFNSANNTKK